MKILRFSFLVFCGVFLFSGVIFSQEIPDEDLQDFNDTFQYRMDRDTALEIYQKIWDPRGLTHKMVKFGEDSLKVEMSKKAPELEFHFSQDPTPSRFPRNEGLKDLRIAIDTANIGGPCSKLEGKYFQWSPS